ncbi:hypothetical protein P4310_27965 [Bacillus thuringiensis]|uniref:hypothetical protein n=1 Tax=Bacillus thuringiensis TaxID=1428 RepID=UPI000A35F196|nr:hypothetical protein [Bacillus thuringiensis]MED3069278.1 hypothetical protein [Bacillus thuringiensis]
MSKQHEFFYCYSSVLHVFLKERGQRYTCAGLNENTLRKFWQYYRTEELDSLLTEWQSNKPQ